MPKVPTSEEVFEEIPSGAEFEKAEDMVIGWVDKLEKVDEKIKPAWEARDVSNTASFNEGMDQVVKAGHTSLDQWEKNEQNFEASVN